MICENHDGTEGCGSVFSDELAWNTETCPRCGRKTGKPRGLTHVNVYSVSREWGGPEEGGWWYLFVPFHSHALVNGENPFDVARDLERRFKDLNRGDISSVLGGTLIVACVEDHFGKVEPETRPHYE